MEPALWLSWMSWHTMFPKTSATQTGVKGLNWWLGIWSYTSSCSNFIPRPPVAISTSHQLPRPQRLESVHLCREARGGINSGKAQCPCTHTALPTQAPRTAVAAAIVVKMLSRAASSLEETWPQWPFLNQKITRLGHSLRDRIYPKSPVQTAGVVLI